MLWERFNKLWNRPPGAYKAGATLQRVLPELQGALAVTAEGNDWASLRDAKGSFSCEMTERIERHFLMHIVAVVLELRVQAPVTPGARIVVFNTGTLKPTGIKCRVSRRHRAAVQGLVERIHGDQALEKALMGLNFRRCEIVAEDSGWVVRLEPYGGSEVVNRMPAFRRYIRLGKGQACQLAKALRALHRILSNQPT